ncbi:Saposin B-type domain-containing protein [Caenorhabditis elegans]|uniref:Saposin B-type domain-containing protein n=1 Tax=Caenorhabditis elegans TaxID=6239 RepID=O76707_CAEEL|nr:Saposin B-type domain-containing protein [Caenorhabditis elegans]CCD70122.2 Saposin B-type domain-containing protein [Caenorhabditis elegans]|eukprot:NP_001256104.2 Uncharacterized protein CELE_ZC190.10 [Caenorhabditis elegans]
MPCLDAPAQFRETVRLTATEQKINGILEKCDTHLCEFLLTAKCPKTAYPKLI